MAVYDVQADGGIRGDSAEPAQDVDATKPRKRRMWEWLTFPVILIALLAAIGGFWGGVRYVRYIDRPDLLDAVQTSGFAVVSYQPADQSTSESVDAMMGGCRLTFVWAVQPLADGSNVVRLALVRDNEGTYLWGPTVQKLEANEAFSICKA